jgi:hypothetical protein
VWEDAPTERGDYSAACESEIEEKFMPLMPKRVKYRKTQRGSRKGTASRNLRIDFGEFGLQTLERAWITNTQIEAARVALTRNRPAARNPNG